MEYYLWALDLSLSNTGVAIFNDDGFLMINFSIPTTPKIDTQKRLKVIGDTLSEYRKFYPCKTIVIENAFSRFNIATQMLYRVRGLCEYLFSDCLIVGYSPNKIKKAITGNGKSDKEEVKKFVVEKYPNLILSDYDCTDAVAIGITYFINKGLENE